MQSNYSDLPNVMSVADAKTFANQPRTDAAHILAYRGATYTVPKQSDTNSVQVTAKRLLPVNTTLHYRGTAYTIGTSASNSARSPRLTKQQLIYRGATYEV